MVKFKLLQFGFSVLISLLSTLCLASAQLILVTDKIETEIGRPIRVEIIAVSLESKLSKIDLTPINKDFGIITDYATDQTEDARWPKQIVQTLSLKLYPRRTGDLIIPSIKLGDFTSQKKQIHVTADDVAEPQFTISSTSPYAREQFTIRVTVFANDLSSRLSINNNDNISGFESSPLKFKRVKQKDGRYLIQTGWALSAINHGIQKFELPVIEYSVSGVSRRKFYLPIQQINIKKLPSYLPPTIPVGKVTIQSKLSKSGVLKTDTIIYWELLLKANLSNSYQLPPVLRQIKSNNKVKYFPATSKRQQKISESELTSSVSHTIPLKFLKSGFAELVNINTQYFDPSSGKIVNVSQQTITNFALNSYMQLFILLMVLILAVFLVNKWMKVWKRYQYSIQQRNVAIQILQNKPTIPDMRLALKMISQAEYWPENMSLKQWKKCWSNKYVTDESFNQLMNDLSLAFYGSFDFNENNMAVIVNKLIIIIKKRKINNINLKSELPAFNL